MDRVTRAILDHPYVVIAAMAVLTALSLFAVRRLEFDISIFSIFDKDSDELREMVALEDHFEIGDKGAFIVAAFEREDLFTHEGLSMLEELTSSWEEIGGLVSVTSLTRTPDLSSGEALFGGGRMIDPEAIPTDPNELDRIRESALSNPLLVNQLVSRDGTAAAVVAVLPLVDFDKQESIEARAPMIAEARKKAAEIGERHGVKVHLSGSPVIGDEYGRQLKSDLKTFIILCTALIALVLFLTFRNARGVFLPSVTILGAAAWTVASMALLGQSINMINSVLPPLVMVIGCADSIHILGRYSEELGRGLERREALTLAFRHIGVAILLTSVTSSIGFISLSAAHSIQVRRLGQFAALGIMFAYIVSIAFIPAVLALLPPGPSMPRTKEKPDIFDRALIAIASANSRHTGKVLLSGLLVAGLSIWGLTLMRTDSRLLQELTERSPFVESTRFIEEKLGGVMDLMIVVETPEGMSAISPEFMASAWRLQEYIGERPEIGATTSLASYVVAMNQAFTGDLEVPDSAQRIGNFVFLMEENEDRLPIYSFIDAERRRLRITLRMHDIQSHELFAFKDDVEARFGEMFPEGSRIYVTGGMLFATRVTSHIVDDLVKSLLLAFVFIFLIVVALFRSFRLGLLSIIPNLLPLLVCMGVMGLFDIRLRMATAMIFAIALGIAVDDTIHFLNRYRAERAAGAGAEEAARITTLTTGRAIMQTSVLLILGLCALFAGAFKASVHFAALSSTIFASALYAALFLLPAAIIFVARRRGW